MGACGSSAAVVSGQKVKPVDDPTRTSLEDVLQKNKREEKRAKSLARSGSLDKAKRKKA